MPSLVMPDVHLNVSHSTVQIGGSVTIFCRSLGYPIPRLSLSMPNGSIYHYSWLTNFQWNVEIGEFADEGGVYRCSSRNSFGTAQDNMTVNGVSLFVTTYHQLMTVFSFNSST